MRSCTTDRGRVKHAKRCKSDICGSQEILGDLRFTLSVEFSDLAGKTPFLVASSQLLAYRPQDEIVESVVRLSGQPRFEEVIDLAGLDALDDPLVTRIREDNAAQRDP